MEKARYKGWDKKRNMWLYIQTVGATTNRVAASSTVQVKPG